MKGTLAHPELMWCYGEFADRLTAGICNVERWNESEPGATGKYFDYILSRRDISAPIVSFADVRRYINPEGNLYPKPEGDNNFKKLLSGKITSDYRERGRNVTEAHNWLELA